MTADSINPEHVYALVVGIEKYQAGADLNGPAQDALNFADWLLGQGVKPEHIYLFLAPVDNLGVLADARARGLNPVLAEREQIESAICDKLTSKDSCGDLLHVFWGGHGFITKTDATVRRLLFADTSNNNKWNLNFNSLLEALSTFARGAGFKQQYFWIDACANKHYQGLYEILGAEKAASEFTSNEEQRRAEQFVLFAAALYEVATNEADLGGGRFSRVVLEELQGKSLLPEMKVLAEKIQGIFRERQQLEPVYFWSKGNGYEEVIDNLIREVASKSMKNAEVFQKITFEQICQALAKAFPSKKLLEIMLQHGMEEKLDLVVPTAASVNDIIFDLVRWAENNERIFELIQAAYQANSRKSELRDIAKLIGLQEN